MKKKKKSSVLIQTILVTSTQTVGLLGTGAQDGHLDFHTAPELCPLQILSPLLLNYVKAGAVSQPLGPRGIKRFPCSVRCRRESDALSSHDGECHEQAPKQVLLSWTCIYWAIHAGLLTPLTFARHRLSPLAAFTSGAYFLHNGRR